MSINVEGADKLEGWFNKLGKIDDTPAMRQAMINSALVVEAKAKQNLLDMIYSAQKSWYAPRQQLFNRTMATKKVIVGLSELLTAVGSFVNYAIYVHFGTGVYAEGGKGRKTLWLFEDKQGVTHRTTGQQPQPYLTEALQASKSDFINEIKKALGKI